METGELWDSILNNMIDQKISNILKARRSTYPRDFNGKKIQDNIIREILKNANYAPSHRMTQPWFFKVYSEEKKNSLAQAIINLSPNSSEDFKKKILGNFDKSSHIICICMKRHEKIVPEWEEIAATSMSVQNIWISLVNSNIGGYWSTPHYINNIYPFLNLNNNERCLGFFYLGQVDSINSRNVVRDSIDAKTTW